MGDRRTVAKVAGVAAATCALVAVVMAAPTGATMAAGAGIVLTLAGAFVVQASRHIRLAAALRRHSDRGRLCDTRVRFTPLDRTVFVAGLARPEIFCSRDLAELLSDDELRAVTLHERHHQRARDPLRLALLATIAPAARRLPGGAAWLERAAAEREIAADRFALDRGVARSTIASALLKVAPAGGSHAAGFSPAVDLRLHALLDDTTAGHGRTGRRWLITGLLVAVAACVAIFHPLGLL